MRDCSEIRPLLPLHAGGDLSGREVEETAAHLSTCMVCGQMLKEYREVIAAGRSSFSGENSLPAPTRARIARDAADARSRRAWPSIWWVPAGYRLAPRHGLLAIAAAALLVLVGLQISHRSGARATSSVEPVVKIEVASAPGGAVRLAWSDGTKASYTVYKSTDPRLLGAGEAHRVSGNVWIDSDAGASQVVYYRIE